MVGREVCFEDEEGGEEGEEKVEDEGEPGGANDGVGFICSDVRLRDKRHEPEEEPEDKADEQNAVFRDTLSRCGLGTVDIFLVERTTSAVPYHRIFTSSILSWDKVRSATLDTPRGVKRWLRPKLGSRCASASCCHSESRLRAPMLRTYSMDMQRVGHVSVRSGSIEVVLGADSAARIVWRITVVRRGWPTLGCETHWVKLCSHN